MLSMQTSRTTTKTNVFIANKQRGNMVTSSIHILKNTCRAPRSSKAAYVPLHIIFIPHTQRLRVALGPSPRQNNSETQNVHVYVVKKVKRLVALQEGTRRAVRALTKRVASERSAFRTLSADVKNQLRALPDVTSSAVGALQVSRVILNKLRP